MKNSEVPMMALRRAVQICGGIDALGDALNERTPKVDAAKVVEQIKVTENKNGKTHTTIKKTTKYVEGDFTWKDPKAAEKAGNEVLFAARLTTASNPSLAGSSRAGPGTFLSCR